ncbi:MAG: hypothetical protein FWE19_05310 [Oscillospiraceae bacterium]|nr:hypothetical protein [Oscillospiraceae bacterium]
MLAKETPMATLKHLLIRLYLFLLMTLFFITGGLSMFVLAPLYKAAIAPNATYSDFAPFKIWAHMYKIIWRSVSQKNYRGLYPFKLTDPPQRYNDLAVMKISEDWKGSRDNCDDCLNRCCAQIDCPILDKSGRCLSFGSLYYGYLFCGRYPSNQGQVDLYDCPKWEVRTANEK